MLSRKIFLVFLALVTLISVSHAVKNATADDDAMPTITVTGTAEVQVVPDEAVLTFSIESREEKLAATVADNDAKIQSVTEFLNGIRQTLKEPPNSLVL